MDQGRRSMLLCDLARGTFVSESRSLYLVPDQSIVHECFKCVHVASVVRGRHCQRMTALGEETRSRPSDEAAELTLVSTKDTQLVAGVAAELLRDTLILGILQPIPDFSVASSCALSVALSFALGHRRRHLRPSFPTTRRRSTARSSMSHTGRNFLKSRNVSRGIVAMVDTASGPVGHGFLDMCVDCKMRIACHPCPSILRLPPCLRPLSIRLPRCSCRLRACSFFLFFIVVA